MYNHTVPLIASRPPARLLAAVRVLDDLFWLFASIARAAPAAFAADLALRAAAAIAPAFLVLVTRHLVDAAVAGAGRGAAGLIQARPWLFAYLAVLLLGGKVVPELSVLLSTHSDDRAAADLERRVLSKAYRLPLASYEDDGTAALLAEARQVDERVGRIWATAWTPLRAAITAGGLAAVFWRTSPWIALGLVAASLPQTALRARLGARAAALRYGQTPEHERARYVAGLLIGRTEQKEIRTFRLEAHLAARWARMRSVLRAEVIRQTRAGVLAGLPPAVLQYAVSAAAVALLGLALARHGMTPGTFVALFGAVAALQSATAGIGGGAASAAEWARSVRDLRRFLDLSEDGDRGPAPEGSTAGAAATGAGSGLPFPRPLLDGIRLEGVSFAYPGRDTPVLHQLDLHIRPGERVALVGANGAGKSTVARLLLGLHAPTAGRITADGLPWAAIARESLHDNVAAAFQDHFRFAFTAGLSIAAGHPAAIGGPDGLTADTAAVERAARLGGAHAFIADLPQGYGTPVGVVLDGGHDLSGGQWQRIALSRALMREPQLLILDEPAAALDPRGEADLYAAFARAGNGPPPRADLLITHRLGAARLADRIVVLRGGRIAEEGTHEALLRAGTEYARMWAEQAAWYR